MLFNIDRSCVGSRYTNHSPTSFFGDAILRVSASVRSRDLVEIRVKNDVGIGEGWVVCIYTLSEVYRKYCNALRSTLNPADGSVVMESSILLCVYVFSWKALKIESSRHSR